MSKAKIAKEPDYSTVDIERLTKANIGARYFEARMEKIPDDASHKKLLLDYISQMHLPKKKGADCRSLLFRGEHGSGKTAAAVLILVEVMARAPALVYFELAANIDHYAMNRDARDSEGQPIWRLLTRDAQFLVLDDLGVERNTDWTSRWIEVVLTERYHRLLPTIITSNIDLDTLYKRTPRLKQLSADEYQLIEFDDLRWRG